MARKAITASFALHPSRHFQRRRYRDMFPHAASQNLEFKDLDCHDGKKNKEGLTDVTCSSIDGSDKFPLQIIIKAANPRCFKNVKSLPVKYHANKKAWMTSEIFIFSVKKTRQEDEEDDHENNPRH